MTDKEQLEQEDTSVAQPLHWGQTLREAREASGIPLREIAAELHLDVSMLEALESEALDKLPGASFVKGYLRSYARLLDLPADELVQAYDCAHGDDAPCLQRIGKVQQMTSKDKGPRYATWGVVVVIVLSVLVWWSSKILTNGVVERGTESAGTSLELFDKKEQPSIEADLEVDGESVSVAPLMVPELAAETHLNSSSEPKQTPQPAPTKKSEPVVEPAVVAPPQQAPATKKAESVVPISDADLSVLTLVFKEDSWVEISDARGKRLFFDLGRKGQDRQLKGVEPFKVLFGNAPGVTLKLNGNVFDHASFHRHNGSAKFSLSE